MAQNLRGQASLIGHSIGNYQVRTLVGRGGTGAVYLAYDEALRRPVALKVLLGSLAHNPVHVRRFQLEAQAAAPLRHKNIVRIYEAGVRSAVPFAAMEYVEGEPLDRFLRRHGALRWQNALYIVQQVAEALAYAHKKDVVHRDIKPANILIDRQGRVRLTDFGIAPQPESTHPLNPAHDFVGTPEYMSPEQCNGETPDAASDFFSLGVMLYQLLTGELPFKGDSPEALLQQITDMEPPRVNQVSLGIPDDVARLVAHLMAKSPKERPKDGDKIVQRIKTLFKEDGGSSALPEALDAFIREEAQPRQLAGDTPTPQGLPKKKRAFRFKRGEMHYSPVSTFAQVAVAIMMFVALAGALFWKLSTNAHPIAEAPLVSHVQFTESTPGILDVPLPNAGWYVTDMQWAGGDRYLLVQIAGDHNTTFAGSTGILSLDTQSQTMRCLQAPAQQQVMQASLLPVFSGKETSTNTLPWVVVPRYLDTASSAIGLFKQNILDDRPEAERLITLDNASMMSLPTKSAIPTQNGLVITPTQQRICVLRKNPVNNLHILEQYHLAAQNQEPLRLVVSQLAILPQSLQYSPDGSQLAYIREDAYGERSLWIVATDGSEENGHPLHVGTINTNYAFHPHDNYLLLSRSNEQQDEVLLIDYAQAKVAAHIGSGRVDQLAWHNSGTYFLLTDQSSPSNKHEVWVVEGQAPWRRSLLVPNLAVSSPGAAISSQGQWAAVTTMDKQHEKITILNLSSHLMSNNSDTTPRSIAQQESV